MFSDISVDARHSGADVDSFHLGGYAGGSAGPLALRRGAAWTWNDIDTSRAVIFPGFFEREKASYSADTGQIFGEVAYPTSMGAIALEPFAVRCAARICHLAARFRRRDARGGACLRLDRHRFHRDGCAACRRQRADRTRA
jgi:hypothetical protein